MSASLLKAMLLLTMLFAVCIGLIHAQPYDDTELRALLTPRDNCPMPCFMGIRPGITSSYEAVGILEAHKWVDEVRVAYHGVTQFPDSVDWSWNGSEPDLISYTYGGFPHPAYLGVRQGTVEFISIPTVISLGDLWLVWGAPDEFRFTTVEGDANSPVITVYVNGYTRYNFWVNGSVRCPYFPAFWREPVIVTIANPQEMSLNFERSSSDVSPFVDFMTDLKRRVC